jgi:flagellin-like hook-associated protein FlgL
MAVTNVYLTSAIRDNLFSLQNTEKAMGTTQQRLATGLKVNSALDDPINFFAAQAHRQRAGDLTLLKDSMNEAIQTLKAADAGISAIMDLIEQAKSVVTASLSTPDTAAGVGGTLSDQFTEILGQIDDVATDSAYKGTNLLALASSLRVAFNEDSSSFLDINGFDASSTGLVLGLTVNPDLTDGGGQAAATTALNLALDALRAQASALSSNLSIVTSRLDFTTNMINTLNTGADNLTLADMNEESAKMLMLQTRQALGTSSLGMASDAAQAILRLF